MTQEIKRRRGTTAQHASFTGAEAELTVDTDKRSVVVHDGSTAGGFPLARESALDERLAKAENLADLPDASAARGNLGLLDSANVPLSMSKAPSEIVRTNATTLTIAAGRFRDEDDTTNIVLPSSLPLSNATLSSSTWYHILAGYDGNGDPAVEASTTIALPSGWQAYRRLGSWRTDGSAEWVNYIQNGDRFLVHTPVLSVNVSDLGNTAVLYALDIPTGVGLQVFANASCVHTSESRSIYISHPDAADVVPGGSGAPLQTMENRDGISRDTAALTLHTNTSGQIRARSNGGSTAFRLSVTGWIDRRGRDK